MSFILLHHVTNVLLFDTEPLSIIKPIVESTRCVREYLEEEYFENSFDTIALKFNVVLVVPFERSDLHSYCHHIEEQMRSMGVSLSVSMVKAEDMDIVSGKAGLLVCNLWKIAGAIILNDSPLTPTSAELLFKQAQRIQSTGHALVIQKHGWWRKGAHFGVLRNESSTGQFLGGSLSRLPVSHTLPELLDIMRQNAKRDQIYWIKL